MELGPEMMEDLKAQAERFGQTLDGYGYQSGFIK